MNKKLLAVAVAGALAAPAAAFAQSSVTISGLLKGGFESLSYRDGVKTNTSQTGTVDDSSRIIFNVVEDLGGGLAAIGQIDMRFGIDGSFALAASGNTWLGLRSKDWGRIVFGRQDLHYFNRESELTAKASLRADSISILAYVAGSGLVAGAGGVPIAGATRSQNVVHYTTPNWGGFTLIAAYSANPTGSEADIGTPTTAGSITRKGSAWKLNPNMAGKDWQVGYSYWRSKPDALTIAIGNPATPAVPVSIANQAFLDQRGDRLYGSYRWEGFKLGFAWDKSKLRTVGGVEVANRTAWSLPASYTWGPHEIHGHYDRARDDKATPLVRDGARMWALAYVYNLSKRTSAALTYAQIRNDGSVAAGGAAYTLFTSALPAPAGLGAAPGTIVAGEDPRMWGVTMRHAF